MMMIRNASDVIDALGGTAAVARMIGRSMQSVSNARRTGRFAAQSYLVMAVALEAEGYIAPPALWGIAEPTGEPGEPAE